MRSDGDARGTAARLDALSRLSRLDRRAGSGRRHAAWREALAGLEEPTRVAPPERRATPLSPEQMMLALSEDVDSGADRQARAQGLTLNTIVQTGLGHSARPADRPR